MGIATLLERLVEDGHALALRLASADRVALTAFGIVLVVIVGAVYRGRRRQSALARAARVQWGIHDLKERLRARFAEPSAPFADATSSAPTMGAWEAFESDIEAVAKTVLVDAAGRRGTAKHLLRQRLNGNGKLNGSEAAHWRQLGALSLLDSTRDALRAYSRAAELNPDDPQAHMVLGVLSLRMGRLEAAETAFRRSIGLAAGADGQFGPHRPRTMLGDVLAAKGEREAALAAYEAALREATASAEREPNDAARQRDISITHDRIGDMLLEEGHPGLALESYRSSLTIADALAKRHPNDPKWQRDLSVAHDRLGEALQRKGDLDDALASFRTGLALAEAIARHDPDRREGQWDVSVSLDRIGDVQLAKGKATEALAAYRRGLAIAEELAAAEPVRTGWQRDLAVSYHKVGTLEALVGNESEARDLLERGRSIIAQLDRIAAYRAQWRADLAKFDQALSSLGA